jgi:hypothetical protein
MLWDFEGMLCSALSIFARRAQLTPDPNAIQSLAVGVLFCFLRPLLLPPRGAFLRNG